MAAANTNAAFDMVDQLMMELDADGDMVITWEEVKDKFYNEYLKDAPPADVEAILLAVREMFDQVDKDGDGKNTYDELLNFFMDMHNPPSEPPKEDTNETFWADEAF